LNITSLLSSFFEEITTTIKYRTNILCFVFSLGEGVNTTITNTTSSDYMDNVVDGKRKRTGSASGCKSEVWMHFTKIYNIDHGLVYVVCHSCDRGYTSGRSTNGTSHLWRHNRSCANKRRRTEHPNPNDATTEWEAEIWPLFLLFKNYGGCDLCSFQIKDIFSLFLLCSSLLYILTVALCFQKQSIRHQGRAEARSHEDGPAG
jgi:hypothetical protein